LLSWKDKENITVYVTELLKHEWNVLQNY